MWEIAVHLAIAGGIHDGVVLCCPFSHEMDLIESVSEGFPTYSLIWEDLLKTMMYIWPRPIFHGPVIWHYVWKTIGCMYMFLGTINQYDQIFDIYNN